MDSYGFFFPMDSYRIPVDSYGFLWIPIEFAWSPSRSHGVLGIPTEFTWIPMDFMNSCGFLWIPRNLYGILWITMDSYGNSYGNSHGFYKVQPSVGFDGFLYDSHGLL